MPILGNGGDKKREDRGEMPRPSILTTYLTILLLRTLFSKGRRRLLSLLSKLVIGNLDHPPANDFN